MTKVIFKVHETIHRLPLGVRVTLFGVSVGAAILAWLELMSITTSMTWNLI
jgi:hypothetical protein